MGVDVVDVALVEAIIWTSEAEHAKRVFVKDVFAVSQVKMTNISFSTDIIDTVVAINAHAIIKVISFKDSMKKTKKVTLVSAVIARVIVTTTAVKREAI